MATTLIVTLVILGIIFLAAVSLAVFDAIQLARGGSALTVSVIWQKMHRKAPWIAVSLVCAAFFLGVILGHLFWPLCAR